MHAQIAAPAGQSAGRRCDLFRRHAVVSLGAQRHFDSRLFSSPNLTTGGLSRHESAPRTGCACMTGICTHHTSCSSESKIMPSLGSWNMWTPRQLHPGPLQNYHVLGSSGNELRWEALGQATCSQTKAKVA